jgi:hypothetical protein
VNLQDEIAQEIKTLLGPQAVADLDFEAVEMAARRQALRLAARALEQCLNADTSDHAGPELALLLRRTGPVSVPPREDVCKCAGSSAPGNGPTITAPCARVDSARATALSGWSCFRSHPGFCA